MRCAELPGRAVDRASARSSGGSTRCSAVTSVARGSAPSGKVSVSGARRGPVKGTVRSSGSRQLRPSRTANPALCTSLRSQRRTGAGVPGALSWPPVFGASVTRSTRTR
ncbi:hypothetical protein GCM10017779_26140 [Streptomyces capillispiralis]|nr:hypothetical protein GCM10017779_26140 [Streptomyces capillispiralis]